MCAASLGTRARNMARSYRPLWGGRRTGEANRRPFLAALASAAGRAVAWGGNPADAIEDRRRSVDRQAAQLSSGFDCEPLTTDNAVIGHLDDVERKDANPQRCLPGWHESDPDGTELTGPQVERSDGRAMAVHPPARCVELGDAVELGLGALEDALEFACRLEPDLAPVEDRFGILLRDGELDAELPSFLVEVADDGGALARAVLVDDGDVLPHDVVVVLHVGVQVRGLRGRHPVSRGRPRFDSRQQAEVPGVGSE